MVPVKKNTPPVKKQNFAASAFPSLKVLMVASEMVPFVKAGGLGDIVGSLSLELNKLGHDVRVVIPKYAFINYHGCTLKSVLPSCGVWMGGICEWCSIQSMTTDLGVTVYVVEHHHYFGRQGLYHDDAMNDYVDNPRRFAFLSRAALQLCIDIKFKPDIIHANDWQTALAPAYCKTWHWDDPVLGKTASVLTLHNIAYQGVYPLDNWAYMGFDKKHFSADAFESYGRINMLKGGIHFADVVNTVSPTYARETTTPYGGFGLAPYLSNKGDNYYGILNGVDYSIWSPTNDNLIPAQFSRKDLFGKTQCKRALQKEFLLPEDNHIAVIGAIGRFVDQKGFDLIASCIETILSTMHVQFVILGSGDSGLSRYFGDLPRRFPGKAGSFIGFNNKLAHLIEAGCDFFLMPSKYEPCGLNQIYSQSYGTLPIVRATGGLDDTVVNYNEATGDGTGFKFWDISAKSLYYTVGWAISTYYDRKPHMAKLIKNAMQQDFSWSKSALEYVKLYEKAMENKKEYDGKYRL